MKLAVCCSVNAASANRIIQAIPAPNGQNLLTPSMPPDSPRLIADDRGIVICIA